MMNMKISIFFLWVIPQQMVLNHVRSYFMRTKNSPFASEFHHLEDPIFIYSLITLNTWSLVEIQLIGFMLHLTKGPLGWFYFIDISLIALQFPIPIRLKNAHSIWHIKIVIWLAKITTKAIYSTCVPSLLYYFFLFLCCQPLGSLKFIQCRSKIIL